MPRNNRLKRDPLSTNPLDFSLPEEIVPFDEPDFNLPIESSARSQLRNLLQNVPEREAVSGKRKILAAITGGLTGATQGGEAGASAATNIMEAPFRRKMSDYQSKLGPLRAEVDLEREDLESENLASQIAERQKQMDPNYRGRLAGTITSAEMQAREPFEESSFGRRMTEVTGDRAHDFGMEDIRNRNQLNREDINRDFNRTERLNEQDFTREQTGTEQRFRTSERQSGERFTSGQNAANRALTREQGDLNRQNQMKINDNDNKLREDLARIEATKKTGVSVDQQAKAIIESEDLVLRQLPTATRNLIGVEIPESVNSTKKVWRFKPAGDITDEKLKEIYETNMREVRRRANKSAYGDISGLIGDTEDNNILIEEVK